MFEDFLSILFSFCFATQKLNPSVKPCNPTVIKTPLITKSVFERIISLKTIPHPEHSSQQDGEISTCLRGYKDIKLKSS